MGVRPADGVSTDDLLGLAASLGSASSHPVSRALANAAPLEARPLLREPREERGLGMHAWQGDEPVAMGRPALLANFGAVAGPVPNHDGPLVALSRGTRFLGWLMLADEPRPESRAAMEALRGLGLTRQLLLTGDRTAVARRIAGLLGITDVRRRGFARREDAARAG